MARESLSRQIGLTNPCRGGSSARPAEKRPALRRPAAEDRAASGKTCDPILKQAKAAKLHAYLIGQLLICQIIGKVEPSTHFSDNFGIYLRKCAYFPSAVTSFSLATELSYLQRRNAMPNGGGGCMLSVGRKGKIGIDGPCVVLTRFGDVTALGRCHSPSF